MTTNASELTAEEKLVLLGELSAADLAKRINDEYGMLLAGEYRTFQPAQAIGEMLFAFRKDTRHGEWQSKLVKWCPKLSYETANRYIKLFQKQTEIARLAAAKNVKLTDLSIDAALKLLAKPKPESGDKPKSNKAAKAAVAEPATEPPQAMLGPPDEIVKRLELEYGDMFEVLKRKYDQDDLLSLTERLAAHLKMKLVPVTSQSEFVRRPLTTLTQ